MARQNISEQFKDIIGKPMFMRVTHTKVMPMTVHWDEKAQARIATVVLLEDTIAKRKGDMYETTPGLLIHEHELPKPKKKKK
jgi:hypothetical protein